MLRYTCFALVVIVCHLHHLLRLLPVVVIQLSALVGCRVCLRCLLLYSCAMAFALHYGVQSDVINEKAGYHIWGNIASEHLLRCIRVCVYILACFVVQNAFV